MGCLVLSFLVFFLIPVGGMILVNHGEHVFRTETVPAVLLVVAVLLAARLLQRRRHGRRLRQPSPVALAGLDWPVDLTRAELEGHTIAWLRAHGWLVTLGSAPDPESEGVYILAARGAVTVGVMCDQGLEEFNPAIIRTFAQEIAALGATRAVLLTLARGPMPHPAEAAARAAGVRLLRIAELPALDTLAPPAAAEPAEAAA